MTWPILPLWRSTTPKEGEFLNRLPHPKNEAQFVLNGISTWLIPCFSFTFTETETLSTTPVPSTLSSLQQTDTRSFQMPLRVQECLTREAWSGPHLMQRKLLMPSREARLCFKGGGRGHVHGTCSLPLSKAALP